MIGRVVAISAAVLVCAWFALGARQAVDTSRATAVVNNANTLTRKQAAQAEALLSSASTLNPDRQVDILRGIVAQGRNDPRRALAIFEGVARAEPMNLTAWLYVAQAGFGLPVVKHAADEIGLLDPGPGKHR
ncbi:MAG: hypothetical protein ACRDNK_03870 [Solirubrobacteraceae bacterium]